MLCGILDRLFLLIVFPVEKRQWLACEHTMYGLHAVICFKLLIFQFLITLQFLLN